MGRCFTVGFPGKVAYVRARFLFQLVSFSASRNLYLARNDVQSELYHYSKNVTQKFPPAKSVVESLKNRLRVQVKVCRYFTSTEKKILERSTSANLSDG